MPFSTAGCEFGGFQFSTPGRRNGCQRQSNRMFPSATNKRHKHLLHAASKQHHIPLKWNNWHSIYRGGEEMGEQKPIWGSWEHCNTAFTASQAFWTQPAFRFQWQSHDLRAAWYCWSMLILAGSCLACSLCWGHFSMSPVSFSVIIPRFGWLERIVPIGVTFDTRQSWRATYFAFRCLSFLLKWAWWLLYGKSWMQSFLQQHRQFRGQGVWWVWLTPLLPKSTLSWDMALYVAHCLCSCCCIFSWRELP